jgi:predicted ester cyclase
MKDNTRYFLAPVVLLSLAILSGGAFAQPLSKENFHEYLSALEDVDAEALESRFYHEDFLLQLGEETMDIAELLEYENQLKSLVDFRFEVKQIVADESGIAIDAIETFDVKRDADVPNIGPARAGEKYELHINVFYGLTDGKISSISANVLSVRKIE